MREGGRRTWRGRRRWTTLILTAGLCLGADFAVAAKTMNGFHLDHALIPIAEIQSGGPPRDGIPAIDAPRFVSGEAAHFLGDDDRVLGFAEGSISKAYPIRILDWHEIVNDRLGDQGLLVTYCPLCGTGVAFKVAGHDQFGVSGLLYNSDVLLYDRASDSLWSQVMAQAVTGPREGERLRLVVVRHTTWGAWRAEHPETIVLAPPDPPRADYATSPYDGYAQTQRLYFPVSAQSRLYHPKEMIVGVNLGERGQRAYPFAELAKVASPLLDSFGTARLRVHFDAAARTGWVEMQEGESGSMHEIPVVQGYWFAWYAFHPKTTVYRAPLAQ